MYDELLTELGSAQFLVETFHLDHRYYPGLLSAPREAFDWNALNHILGQHRLESPRLRLLRGGATLPGDSYFQRVRMRDGRVVSYVNDHALSKEMERGATLVIEAIDEACEEVGWLANKLQQLLRSQVGASIYASRGHGSTGLGDHWDDVDILVIQLDGEKVWELRGPSRIWPLYRDSQRNEVPPEEVLARYELRCGDVLYVPRGWWHTVESTDSPSLHLAFGIASKTGTDLISWISDRLLECPIMRQDLPRFLKGDERKAYVQTFRTLVNQELSDDVLDRFFDDDDARADSQSAHSLPWTIADTELTQRPRMVRVSAARMTYTVGKDAVVVIGNGHKFILDLASEPVVALLLKKRTCSFAELCSGHGSGLGADEVLKLLIDFAKCGLVALS